MSDLIDRQAAIDVVNAVFPVDPNKSEYASGIACGAALALTYIKQLPSAQPEYFDYTDIDEAWEYYAKENDANLTDNAKQIKDAMWVGYRIGLKSAQPETMYYPQVDGVTPSVIAQPEPKWIPCSERLPDNRVSVIICYREWQQYAKRYVYSIVIGWYARKHSVMENVFSEWEADCDYDEDEDEFYIHEGWYEFTTQGNYDLMNWYINAEVIAWMPLPKPYKGDE